MYYFSVCECPQMSVFTYMSQPPPYFKCLHPSAILVHLADFIISYPLLWSIYRNRGRWGVGYEKNGWDSPKAGRINTFCTLCNMFHFLLLWAIKKCSYVKLHSVSMNANGQYSFNITTLLTIISLLYATVSLCLIIKRTHSGKSFTNMFHVLRNAKSSGLWLLVQNILDVINHNTSMEGLTDIVCVRFE